MSQRRAGSCQHRPAASSHCTANANKLMPASCLVERCPSPRVVRLAPRHLLPRPYLPPRTHVFSAKAAARRVEQKVGGGTVPPAPRLEMRNMAWSATMLGVAMQIQARPFTPCVPVCRPFEEGVELRAALPRHAGLNCRPLRLSSSAIAAVGRQLSRTCSSQRMKRRWRWREVEQALG